MMKQFTFDWFMRIDQWILHNVFHIDLKQNVRTPFNLGTCLLTDENLFAL